MAILLGFAIIAFCLSRLHTRLEVLEVEAARQQDLWLRSIPEEFQGLADGKMDAWTNGQNSKPGETSSSIDTDDKTH